MALHGEIAVNSQPIARWYARRTEDLKHLEDRQYVPIYAYECEVVRYQDGKKVNFILYHNYEDGGLVLAADVIRQGSHYLNTIPVEPECIHARNLDGSCALCGERVP
jgi:hypothetical protein